MKNLLITTFGKYNHAEQWIIGECNFDIALTNYDNHIPNPEVYNACIGYDVEPVYKYEGIARMLNWLPDFLDNYDYFYMPDEDVLINSTQINRVFELMEEYQLDLAQPSVEESADSFLSWRIFKHDPMKDNVIPTDFIECMNPCFSKTALLKCLPTFTKSKSGYGLDLVWPKLIGTDKIAILNSIVVKHTRPIGKGDLYRQLASQGIVPDDEMHRLMKEYGIEFNAKAHN